MSPHDPFSRVPYNAAAVNQAWINHHWYHRALNDSVMEMVLTGGVTFGEARVYLASSSLPSTSGLMAGAS
jgi:hypothetical protein